MSVAWSPLLTGPSAARARGVLDCLAADLVRFAEVEPILAAPPTPPRFSLVGLEGFAGIALFLTYLDRSRGTDGFGDASCLALERAIDALRNVPAHAGLHGGFSGLAWTVEHLQGPELDPDDPGSAIAERLYEHLEQNPWQRDYDLIGGLVGFGIWALERMPRPRGAESLGRVVRRLAELVEETPQGLTWRTPRHRLPRHQQDRFPEGHWNLGVAHGVPGVLAVLAEAHAAGIERAQAARLLDRAVPWLLAQRSRPESGEARFPFFVAPDVDPEPSGFAWCYGDLGIAPALLAVARRLERPDWEAEAIELGLGVARRGLPASGDRGRGDACLCHGAAGNGHLFHRLYRATGQERFAEAAVAWFDRALSLHSPDRGLGGFLFWDADAEDNLSLESLPGFLNGSAGVGLALLAATTDTVPGWDRLLLADVQAAGAAYQSTARK